jgi:hypothetical protein
MLPESPQNAERPWERDLVVTVVCLAAILGGMLLWYTSLTHKDASLSAEIAALTRQDANITSQLNDARPFQWHVKKILDTSNQVTAEMKSDLWAAALRSIAIAAGPDIELRVIHVFKLNDDSGGRQLRIDGTATGQAPPSIADDFRQRLQSDLERHFRITGPCKLEQVDEVPPASSSAGTKAATFTITVSISPAPTSPMSAGPKH